MFNPDSFRAARWIRTLNLVLQAVLFLTFCLGLNYLAQNHVWRKDLTSNRRYSLSAETLSYLKNLESPIRVIVTLPEDSEDSLVSSALPDIQGLLREYKYVTAGNSDPKTNRDGRISVEYLDVWKRRAEAAQLSIDQQNVVVFLCRDKRRIVTLAELFNISVQNNLPRIDSFMGEQVFTSAVLDVSNVEKKKIYFLGSEGELRIDDPNPVEGLSSLAVEIAQRNFALETLDLATARRIPADAALVIAAGPQSVDPAAKEMLRQYLQQAGRMILMLRQDGQHRLDDLLYDWGVQVDTDLICEDDPAWKTDSGDLRLGAYGEHPVTQSLRSQNLNLRTGAARSLRPEPGRANVGGLKVTTLVATSESAYGETSPRPFRREFNLGVDIKGSALLDPPRRLGVIVASERLPPPSDLSFSVKLGKLIVIGTTDIATNQRLEQTGNLTFMLNAVNWAVGRDTQLNVPPRPVERYQLSLSQQELMRLRFSLLFMLPGGAALIGLLVYWTRRK